jgi:DNA-binding helix-hairpin-helix protein with protein kinase domain
VMLIDLDSVQFVDRHGVGYLSPLHTEEYLAPELDPATLNHRPRQPQADLYALAFLLFQLLMAGFEPYTGRRKDGQLNDLAQQSRDGAYAYGRKVTEIAPPRKAPPISVLSSELRGLFEQTFVDGARDPGRRASARTLEQALRRQARALLPCNGMRTHHTLNPHACEWCQWEQRVGLVTRAAPTRPAGRPARAGARPAPFPTPTGATPTRPVTAQPPHVTPTRPVATRPTHGHGTSSKATRTTVASRRQAVIAAATAWWLSTKQAAMRRAKTTRTRWITIALIGVLALAVLAATAHGASGAA